MFSPRALFLAFPALMVVAGALLMARSPEWPISDSSDSTINIGSEIVIGLSTEDESRLEMIHQKQLIGLDLLHDRCTLAAATDKFLKLNTSSPEALDNLRFAWQGQSDW